MLVPRHWAEARLVEPLPGRRQATLRRFGWSSESQADAEAHARRRVEEAATALRAGGARALATFTRRERAVAYAGADGLPIREEIVEEDAASGAVVTRNVYGSACLNTAEALFVDVDPPEDSAMGVGCILGLGGAGSGALAARPVLGWHPLLGALAGFAAFAALGAAVARARRASDPHARDPVRFAVDRTRAWCRDHPGWLVAVYATPRGARLLALHSTFAASDPATLEFMSAVRADPIYVRMCRLQKCFRARVSPKPWRAGVTERFRAGGTWPVRDADRLAARSRWVARYEQAAARFASCRLVETVGDGQPEPRVERIRRLHDERCRATADLPLA